MKLHSLPYPVYVETYHNEWVSQLPEEWEEKRVKDLFRLVTDLAPKDNDFELLSLYTALGVKPRKDMEQRGNKSVTTEDYWIVKKGDIIVNKLLAWMGAVGLSDYDGVTSPAYDILRRKRKNKREVDERFYTYLFRTEKAKEIFRRHSRGIMEVRLRLYFDKFGALTVPAPSFAVQKAIADYLDAKTTQIDCKIELLEQKAERYADLKQSLINETVTRGLDKTVPMKDSGVEWIGQIPSHWEVKRVKEIAYINKKALQENTADDYEFDYVDISSVTYGVKDYKTEKMTFNSSPSRARRIVQKGDIIISTVRTYLKAITWFDRDVKDLIVSTGFAVITPKKQVINKYCSYWLTSNTFVDEVCALSTGVSYPATNASSIGNLFCLIPPLGEQKAIADYIEAKTAYIEKILETINLEVEKLKELRKTLINDVVTGKIKVYQA